MTDTPFDPVQLHETTETVEERLYALSPDVLDRHPLSRLIGALDEDDRLGAYPHVPEACASATTQIAEEGTSEAAELYRQLILLALIAKFHERRIRAKLPPSVMPDLAKAFSRIVEQIRRSPRGYFAWENDLFMKDLHICRLRLVPTGPEAIDLRSGVPRSLLLGSGAGHLVGGALFFLRTGGMKPFFELHSHPWSMAEFDAAGYERCYTRVAELLLTHPDSLGLVSKSWWHDPRVAELSPELSFLTDPLLENGAKLFRGSTATGTTANATNFAPARKEAFDQGTYLPRNYMLVWPRRNILTWAETNGQMTA